MIAIIDIINNAFYSIIEDYKFNVINSSDKDVELSNGKCIISVSWHLGEVYVNIKNPKDMNVFISPILWAYIIKKLNYKEIIGLKFNENIVVKHMLEFLLVEQSIYIGLFCKELLEGNFSKWELYKNNQEQFSREMSDYKRLKMK